MPEDMSFLPEDYVERRVAQRTNIICITLFMVVLGAVVAAWFVDNRQDLEVKQARADMDNRLSDAATKLDQLEQLQSQKQQMLRKANVTAVLVERLPRSLLLAELINNMPATLSLLEFDMDTKIVSGAPRALTAMQQARQQAAQGGQPGQPVIEAPETDVTVSMIGVAPTDVEVAQFIAALSGHQLFRDVNLQYSEQTKIDNAELRKFRLSMRVNQDISAADLEPLMVQRDLKSNPMSEIIHIDESGHLVAPPPGVAEVPTQP